MKRWGRREFFGWGRHFAQADFLKAFEEGKRPGVVGFVPGETSKGHRFGWVVLAEKRLDPSYHPTIVGSDDVAVISNGHVTPSRYGMGCFSRGKGAGKVYALQLHDVEAGTPTVSLLMSSYKDDEVEGNVQVLGQWQVGCCPKQYQALVGAAEGELLDRMLGD